MASNPKHFLDELTYPFSNRAAAELRDLLLKVYSTRTAAKTLAETADVDVTVVDWEQPIFDVWNSLLREAPKQDRLRKLVDTALMDAKTRGSHAKIRELIGPEPILEPPAAEGSASDAPEGNELQIEPLPTLLHIAFLEGGLRVAPSVVRLTATFSAGRSYGTGFMIAKDLVLTNHHVLYDWKRNTAPAARVEVRFGYENDEDGREREFETCEGIAASIAGDREDDWAIVRLAKLPERHRYPILGLSAAKPPQVDDRVTIIQHPKGEAKQIGLHHNEVTLADDRIILYRTDTEGGSSGSPVFNERWEVVALHHKWTEVGQLAGKRIYRNEGIRIERVVAGLKKQGITFGEAEA